VTLGLESVLLLAAVAGYGDVDTDGYASWAERDVHLWTNAARVDPEAFEAEYLIGGCSLDVFTDAERTPQLPVYYNRALNEAARYHSDDMVDNGCFQHNSCDGTDWGERISRYYSGGSLGENIAYGYGDGWNTVFYGWMCSESGHRENIMSSGWNELGTGVNGTHVTQDFAAGSPESNAPVRMGLHFPEDPTTSVAFYTDWGDDEGPIALYAVMDGVVSVMTVEWGEETKGIFRSATNLPEDDVGCHEYYFHWETSDGKVGSFPEEGSYQFGTGCDALMWVEGQIPIIENDDGGSLLSDVFLVGCSTAPSRSTGSALLGALFGLIGLRGRRRAR
jgi:hypothetical protein